LTFQRRHNLKRKNRAGGGALTGAYLVLSRYF
jgi:hypothetical protein